MKNHLQSDEFIVKEEHSQLYTIKSMSSKDQIIDIIPVYNTDDCYFQYNSGHWSAKEHIKYIMFLDYFSHLFILKHNKKLWKIFTIMSSFIKTRNSSQCRSHHQKTQRKYTSIEQVLQQQRKKYRNYKTQYQKMKKVLQKLRIDNPLQVQNQKQTAICLPSIKILEENFQYKIYRNSFSMVNIDQNPKINKKSKQFISEKLINYDKEKYIDSEVSIQLDEEDKQDEKQKEIMNQIEPQIQNKQKHHHQNWITGLLNSQIQDKNQKFIKTTDTYTDEKRPHNIIKMKKSRSSLPSFDILSTTQGSQYLYKSTNNKLSQKQSNLSHEQKCKTYITSQKEQSEQSQSMSQKIFSNYQQANIKSLFSGFVSSIYSGSKSFDVNNSLNQEQYTSFNNLCNLNNKEEGDEEFFVIKRKKKNQKQRNQKNGYRNNKPNLFFCEDRKKGNLCNQISDSSACQFLDESMEFIQPIKKLSKIDSVQEKGIQQSVEGEFFIRNFSKKKSSQISNGSKKQSQQIQKKKVQTLNHSSEMNKSPQQNQLQSPLPSSQSNQGFRPYSNPINESQNYQQQNSHNPQPIYPDNYINYYNFPHYAQPFYNPHQILYVTPNRYSFFQYQLRNFLQFYIMFFIWKINQQNQINRQNGPR